MMTAKEAIPSSGNSAETRPLVAALEHAAAAAQPLDMIALIGELERLKILLWHRLLTATAQAAATPIPDGLDDLRHLSPGQVAELLNVKPAYVHELCRTGRLAAIKEGKYWLIPQAALRERLMYRRSDIDPASEPRLQSTKLRDEIARGPRGRPRRSPALMRQEGRWRERS